MICLSSRAKHAEEDLAKTEVRLNFYIEESGKHLDRAHEAENIADELRDQLSKALKERDEARSQRDASALYASSQEGCAKSWKEAADREARKAEAAGVVAKDTDEKLRKAELSLDMARDRREAISNQLDELRIATGACCLALAGAADWLRKNSSSGSVAREIAELLQEKADGADDLLNN